MVTSKLPSIFSGEGETTDAEALTTVVVGGAASTDPDPADIGALSYEWSLFDPALQPVALAGAAPTASFFPNVGGTWTMQLKVRDVWTAPSGNTAELAIYINRRPLAAFAPFTTVSSSFGETRITSGLTLVNLQDGSSDPDNDVPLSYFWEAQSAGGFELLTTPSSQHPVYTPSASGPHTVRHTVRDFKGLPAATTPAFTDAVN